jgi:hypothetical protein
MNARDEWPAPAETPQWWRDWAALTDAEKDALGDQYQREQIASAQSEQAQEANQQEHRK